jgi:hypothetical protein
MKIIPASFLLEGGWTSGNIFPSFESRQNRKGLYGGTMSNIIRAFNAAAAGSIPAAVSICVIAMVIALLIGFALTGVDLIGWDQ